MQLRASKLQPPLVAIQVIMVTMKVRVIAIEIVTEIERVAATAAAVVVVVVVVVIVVVAAAAVGVVVAAEER